MNLLNGNRNVLFAIEGIKGHFIKLIKDQIPIMRGKNEVIRNKYLQQVERAEKFYPKNSVSIKKPYYEDIVCVLKYYIYFLEDAEQALEDMGFCNCVFEGFIPKKQKTSIASSCISYLCYSVDFEGIHLSVFFALGHNIAFIGDYLDKSDLTTKVGTMESIIAFKYGKEVHCKFFLNYFWDNDLYISGFTKNGYWHSDVSFVYPEEGINFTKGESKDKIKNLLNDFRESYKLDAHTEDINFILGCTHIAVINQ